MFQLDYVRNQAMRCAVFLVEENSFEPRDGSGSAFSRVVDDQHALLVHLRSADYLSRGDTADGWTVNFGIARRDLNDHLVAWRDKPSQTPQDWLFATIQDMHGDIFVADRWLEWSAADAFSDGAGELAAGLVGLESWANLESIESQLYRADLTHRYQKERAVNDALNGDDRSMADYIAFRDEHLNGTSAKGIADITRFDEALQAFRAAHPSGITR